jgi:hypothetical protein
MKTQINRTTRNLLVNRCHIHEMRKRGLKNPPAGINTVKVKGIMGQFR